MASRRIAPQEGLHTKPRTWDYVRVQNKGDWELADEIKAADQLTWRQKNIPAYPGGPGVIRVQ